MYFILGHSFCNPSIRMLDYNRLQLLVIVVIKHYTTYSPYMSSGYIDICLPSAGYLLLLLFGAHYFGCVMCSVSTAVIKCAY